MYSRLKVSDSLRWYIWDTSEFLTCLIGGSINLVCSDLAQCQSSNRCCQTVDSSLFHYKLASNKKRQGGGPRSVKWLHGRTLEDSAVSSCQQVLNEELQDAMARMYFDIFFPSNASCLSCLLCCFSMVRRKSGWGICVLPGFVGCLFYVMICPAACDHRCPCSSFLTNSFFSCKDRALERDRPNQRKKKDGFGKHV